MLSRLQWRNPFDRRASVLHAIKKAKLPLQPPDEDVETLSSTEMPPLPHSQSRYSIAFLSHTTKDESVIQQRILPVIRPFFAEVFFMNVGMRGRSPEIVEAYKRRIVSALSKSEWFIVAVSGSAASSKWVGFEFAWALRHRDHRRILALVLDDTGRRAYLPVLRFVRTIDSTAASSAPRMAIERALRRSGARIAT